MKVDREKHPHLTEADIEELIKSMTGIEVSTLADYLLENIDQFEDARALKNLATRRRIEQELEDIDDSVKEVRKYLKNE